LDEVAVRALLELAKPRKYVRGRTDGRQLDLELTLGTLDDRRNFRVNALLDSGCTGSCIDRTFVKENGINTEKLPILVMVYNADGTPNSAGAITETVRLHVKIQSHIEIAEFAVTDLGKTNMFIGHEWLKKHNPSIDWAKSEVEFDRCPIECMPLLRETHPEDEEIDYEDLEDGEKIIVVDVRQEIQLRAFQTKSSKLAEEAQRSSPRKTFDASVPSCYHGYEHVFTKEAFDEIPARRPWDHAIELVPGAEMMDCKIYPLNLEEQIQLDTFLEENLRSGRIRPSKSPMASPFFFVKKKDGSLRPVQDYRRLNNITVKNRYPLPLIQELVDKLKKAKYFTKLDVRWGFNNVRIKEGDEWKAAFQTNRGLFEPLVMFFGLTNSPATFQTMMNTIFREEINSGKVIIYMDDVLIFTETLEEHRRIVEKVLAKFSDNQLFLNPDKCTFEANEIEYLGLIVSQNQVWMDPVKVEAVREWPAPKNKKEVQQFLGFVNFYRRFIEGYSRIAKPLTELTGNSEWRWEQRQADAFNDIRSRVSSAPILVMPYDEGKYRVEADSSDYAMGAILSQEQTDGKWRPVAFLSKTLSETERNYQIYDKEMLAVMRALSEWRQYLLGAKQKFEIWTDHKNLEYFRLPQKLNCRQARWTVEMQEYNFEMRHKPGPQMIKADLLSRRAGHPDGKDDNEGVTLLPEQWFWSTATQVDGAAERILEKVREAYERRDKVVVKSLAIKEADWEEVDRLVTWKGRVYIPQDQKLRAEVIRLHHDLPTVGHLGIYKTHKLITRNYWWPRILANVRVYVGGCEICQRVKPKRTPATGLLNPNEVPSHPWEVISVDMIGPLPESNGFDAILVFVDRFLKKIEVVPTNVELSLMGTAKLYKDNVFKHHGLPRKFISDRGKPFVSRFMRDLCTLLGIERNPSTAYHPITDGQTERINQEIEQYLRIFINERQNDWADWLSIAQFAYNDKVHSSTGYSPFFLNYG